MSTLETNTMTTTTGESRHKGHVKFFNSTKGYGFILPDNQLQQQDAENMEEVFVHHTAIHNSGGFKSLAEGEQVEYDLVQGPKGMQASNVTGPNGSSVQGDPRTHRQQYPSGNSGYRNNNNNRGGPYSGGYMVDPYASPFGYAVPGFPFMNVQQAYGGQFGGQQTLPPQLHHQYGYQQHSPMNSSNSTSSNTHSNNNNSNNPILSPQLLQQQAYSGGYPSMTMYPNYQHHTPAANYENNTPPLQHQQQTSITPPNNNRDESCS